MGEMKSSALLIATFLFAVQCGWMKAQTIADRANCGANDVQPEGRVNTTGRLASFRTALANIRINNRNVAAFIVGSADAHNSEYPTEYDRRRAYITGFEGSAGTAVITQTKAALWTDGRYYLEADEALDCNWILMKEGMPDIPSIEEWINSEMTAPGEYIGVDRTLITHTSFTTMRDTLLVMSNRPELQASTSNPVDTTWTAGRPAQPNTTINALNRTFAGVSWQDKITNLRANLTSKAAAAFVVTALDEVAWLFNLRASDISYNPFFLAYAIVEMDSISLYILDKGRRLTAMPTDPDTDVNLATHLGTSNTGSCVGASGTCVEVLDYSQSAVEAALTGIANTGTVWITYDANYAIYSAISNNRIIEKSPVALDKSKKNSVERAGMQRAYNRDSAALIKFLAYLDQQVRAGNTWTEVTAGAELDRRRSELDYNRGLSFETISSYGSNGAIIHYRPSNSTDKTISTDSLYLLDSGGQYLDGTTDVTRTMHYGTPTAYQKECYTRVLMSAINLALLKWPEGLYGRQIDAIARYALWDAGLVYRHGTGHGIGAFLSVHEGPGRIRLVTELNPSDEPLTDYQYFSDEPGYYEDGAFGIRLETVVMVNPITPEYTTAGEQFYEFQPITYVPFEPNLIDYALMNAKQVEWLNEYNTNTRDQILPLLSGDQTAIDWFNARTQQVNTDITCHGSASRFFSTTSIFTTIFVTVLKLIWF